MGFCLFNNMAIAAAHARARALSRAAIVDYNVHHGNGTRWSFYDDWSVLFILSHQYPFYPGHWSGGDTRTGAGGGITPDLLLQGGATHPAYDSRDRTVPGETIGPVPRTGNAALRPS